MKRYPLLQSQMGVFAECIKNPDSAGYNLPYVCRLPDDIDLQRLKKAWEELIRRHRVFRTRFGFDEKGEVYQYSDESMQIPVIMRYDSDEQLQAYIRDGFMRAFDLLGGEPLVRVELVETEKGKYQLMDMSHVIGDGTSVISVINHTELPALYDGREPEAPAMDLYEAAEREAAEMGNGEYEQAKAYYRDLYADAECATLCSNPPKEPKPMIRETLGMEREAVDSWCEGHGIKVHHLFRAAFVYVMGTLCRQDRLAYFSSHAGREKETRNAVGMFVKSVPLADTVDWNAKVTDYIRKFGERQPVRLSAYPFTHFCADLKKEPVISFNFMGVPSFQETLELGGHTVPCGVMVRGTTNADLSVHVYWHEQEYEIRMESSEGLNDRATMLMVGKAIRTVMRRMMEHPEGLLKDIALADGEETEQLMALSRGEDLDYDREQTWLDLFRMQAEEGPDRTAVADGCSRMTYRELDEASDRLAAYLAGRGVQTGDFVAIRLPRSKEFIAAILGIHKAGAAYVPVDPSYPPERVDYMLEDSEAKLLISELSFGPEGPAVNGEKAAAAEARLPRVTPDDLAYMIYTSGSTGKPKGVMLTHRGLMNFTVATAAQNELTPADRVASHRSFSFDAHIEDVFPVLASGAAIHIMPEEIRKDLDAMAAFLRDRKITGCGFTTSIAKLLIQGYELPVRYMTAGGEALTHIGSDSIQIINEYGPTECTNDTCVYKLEKGRFYTSVPVGRPMPNSWCFIVDRNGHLLPRGASGELCYAGPQVGRGYWKLEEKTAEVFGDCPFVPGIRMYHTGDLARWNSDGLLECLGRIDHQVKLRGYRIEMGEIESLAASAPGVAMAAAAVKQTGGTPHLVLYYTEKEGETAEEEALRSAIEHSSLAEYMYPDVYMKLAEMPKLPNGKINRKQLPEPEISGKQAYTAPENAKEEAVIAAMKAALGLSEQVGALDSFFEWGGDSIKAIRMVSLLRQGGLTVSVSDIMREKTVRRIANACRENRNVRAEQQVLSGPAGVSPIYGHFFASRYAVPSHFNQAALYRCGGKADPAALQKALDALTEQHDMLRAVCRDGQVIIREAGTRIPAEYLDLRQAEDFRAAAEAACAEIQAGIRMEEALLRVCLLEGNEDDYVFFCAHHLITDGVSWRILRDDLESAYRQAAEGQTEIRLPEKTHSYPAYVKAMDAYRDSWAMDLEAPFWKRTERKVRGLPHRTLREGQGNYGHITLQAGKEQTKEILSARLGKWKLEINDLWLAAVCGSYLQLSGQDSVSVQMEGHGREDIGAGLLTDRTIGWFTSMYPAVFEGVTGKPETDLLTVKETLRKIPNKGAGYQLVRTPPDAAENATPWISFNYLGEMDAEEQEGCFFRQADGISSGPIWDERNYQGSALLINAFVRQGQLTLTLDYDRAVYSGEQAESFARQVTEKLSEAAECLREAEEQVTASDLGETEWSPAEFEAVRAEFAARGETIQRILPMSGMQEAMLLKHLTDPESPAYRLVFIYRCAWLPGEESLNRAFTRLLKRHEVLRSAIVHEGVSVNRQVITDRIPAVEMLDYSSSKNPEQMVLNLRKELLKKGFDLQRKPLFRLIFIRESENSGFLMTVSHHIIQDGWSMQLYMDDLKAMLEAERQGQIPPEAEGNPGAYEQAVRELARKDRKTALAYWREMLSGYETKAEIPSWGEVPAEARGDDEMEIAVSAAVTEKLNSLCTEEEATISNGIELIWGLVLQVYSRSRDVIFGKVVSGRDNTETDVSKVVGLFINSVPLRLQTEEKTTAREAIRALQQQAAASSAHDFCMLAEIMEAAGLENGLLGTVMAFENYSSGREENPQAAALPMTPFCMKEEIFDAVNPVTMIDGKGQLRLHIGYDPAKYYPAEIRRLLRLFRHLAGVVAEFPDMPLRALPRTDMESAAEIAELSHGKELAYDRTKTFIDLFVHQAYRQPEHEAAADSAGILTYGELDRISDRLAAALGAMGIGNGSFVAVRMPRVKEFPAAVIGVMKAGAAYIPVDPEYPEDRISYMLEDSGAKLVLTEEKMAELLEQAEGDFYPVNRTKPEGLAYMIYTSGSTGKPKGVMQTHRALSAFLAWRRELLHIDGNSRHAQHASFSFDASLDDLLCPLAFGGSVHILGDELRKDLAGMNRYFLEKHITGLTMSTQIGMAMIEQFPDLPLQFLMMGGEKMLPFRRTSIRVINGYGPTEFTVCSSYHEVDQEKDRNIPIGRPVPNSWSLICDEAGRLLPRGLAGELCLAGPQTAEGYWKREELTKEKFAPVPEVSLLTGGKTRVYRTGDLARYNEEGELEYLGRIDDQVKLRGFRIELGEIENAAAQYEGVSQAAAKVCRNGSLQTLCLYYTARTDVDEAGLRGWLESNLTEYMVPSVFMRLESLPLTPNGKINKKALPEPVMTSSREYTAPEGAAEEAVARTMQAILGLDQPVGANDNFFELGGDSIKAIRMVSMLRNEQVTLQVSDIMKHKTVRLIARAASPEQEADASQEPFEGPVGTSPIMGFFRDLDLPVPTYFNQSRLLACRERMDAGTLRAAMKPILKQHDLLRAVLRNGELVVPAWDEQQEIRLPEEADLRQSADWQREISCMCEAAQASFTPEAPLLRMILFHGPEKDLLFLCAHHLIIDGVSWSILLGDLEDACGRVMAGKEPVLPVKTSTYHDYVKAAEAWRNSYALEKEIPYWQKTEQRMLALPTSAGKDHSRRFGTLELTADREQTDRILQARIGNYHAERNDYLMTALALCCLRRFGWTGFSVQLEGHGREPISEQLHTDRTIGWFTSVYPVVFGNITEDIGASFRNVKETMHRIPNKGVGYNILRYISGESALSMEKNRWPMVGFNYLGEISGGQQGGSLFETAEGIRTGEEIARENLFGPSLMINCLVENGRFRLFLQYDQATADEAGMQAFAEEYLRELDRVAEHLKQMEEPVQTASDLGETEWSDSEFNAVVKDFAQRGEKLERIYPLTPMQEGILLKYLSEKDSWAYRLVTIIRLDFVPEEALLVRVADMLLERNPVLRSAIIYDGVSEYRQAITNRRACVRMADLSGETDHEAAVLELRKQILTNDYELQRKPLFQLTCTKTGEKESYLLFATHHIIVDGWCIPLLAGQMMEMSETGSIAESGGNYEAAVRDVLGRDRREAMKYWAGLLEGYETPAEIPAYALEKEETGGTDTAEIFIDRETTEKLAELCRKEGVTLGTAVELAWALLLGTAADTDDVVFAKVVSGRDNARMAADRIIGLFINAIPVRVKTDSETTVAAALKALQEQSARSSEYDYCALEDIIELTPLGNKLFQSVFAFENYNSGAARKESGLQSHFELFYSKEENIDLLTPSASVTENGELMFRIVYDNTMYREAEMRRIVRLYSLLVHEIAEKPEERVRSLRRVDDEDAERIISLSRGETLAYDESKTWTDLFLERLAEDGNRLAVDDGTNTYTYAELDEAAGRLAAYLKAQGVRENEFVAIRMPRSREVIAAILAVHKLGAAYVPIDPAYPEARVSYMLEDCRARVMVKPSTFGKLSGERYDGRPSPDNLAYMIYTSGSTGKPKGAILHQRGLMNFTVATAAQNELTPEDRVASHRSFSFDAHIEDVFPVLASGASIHIMPEEIRKDFEAIARFIREHRATGCGFTTSIGKTLLTDFDLPVRYMTVGGEALTGVTGGKIQIINEYGPTECTNDTCVYKLERGRSYRTIPIGRPMPNSWCFVTDRYGNLVPRGFAGELCYAGPQVGRGYWNLPEKTAEAFSDCPFVPGQRMYRTGDLARYNEEGQIEALGRKDGQVKLRGYRIETGEVEDAAMQDERVQAAAAQVREISGSRHLVLYYTQKDGPVLTGDELRHTVERSSLAEYMRPEIYMKLDEMPRLPNGKINRRALPEPEANLRTENVPPETAEETHFLRAAKELLPGVEFGVTDDLFMLGLTSLTAMRLAVKINAMDFHEKYRVSDIMRYKSIRELIQGNQRSFWQYDEYDPEKPYLVFLYGIAPIARTLGMLAQWKDDYNIFVIEPIDAHYEYLFNEESTFEDVVDTYSLILERNIPKGARIAGMAGFSWGGILAYRLCERWSTFRDEKPFALMGDSYLINAVDGYRQTEVSEKDFPENLFDLTAGAITQQEVIRKTNISIRMDNTVTSIPEYDGPVIFLNALQNYNKELKQKNNELLKKLAKNAEIIDFPNHSHNDLFFDESQVPLYLKLMLRQTK